MTARSLVRALPPDGGDEEAGLWTVFREQADGKAREKLFQRYLPMARRLAHRFHRNDLPNAVEYEELFQLACTGLLEALDRFRPELNVPFRFYAPRRINGAILNGIARHSEVNHQISVRKRVARERTESLRAQVTSSDELADLIEALGEIAAGLALGLILEDSRLYSSRDEDPAPNAYETLAWKQVTRLVSDEVEQLPPRDQDIIRLHYLEGVPFDQIAAALGLSKGRISQIHKAAIALLRKRLLRVGQFRMQG